MELKQIATIHTDFPETKRTGRTAKGADHIGTGLPESGSIPGTCGIFSYLGALGIFTGEERKMVTDR